MLRAYEGDIDTILIPPRTQYGAIRDKAEKRNGLRYQGLACSVHTAATPRLSPVMSSKAIRVCSNGFTATVLQPGWYTLVRNGHKIGSGTPKRP